jgi:hypothetical protein
MISKGLPEPSGTIIPILAASSKNPGKFFALTNRGVFCSTDSGILWKALDILWPKEYLSQHPWSIAIEEEE